MTTKISAIIAQQIASQTRLIIPEVGTLIRRKESGEIVFMEMLRKSDGALASAIMQTLDVSPSKASELINRYTATIKQQLATNKKFILDGVGVLLARPDGGVDFSFNPFSQSIPEPTQCEDVLEEGEEDVVAPESKVAPKVAAPVKPAVAPEPKPAPAPKPAESVVSPKPAAPARPVAPKPTAAPEPAKQRLSLSDEAKAEALKSTPRKKVDGITIIAILALALALLSLIWGAMPSRDQITLDVEQVAE